MRHELEQAKAIDAQDARAAGIAETFRDAGQFLPVAR